MTELLRLKPRDKSRTFTRESPTRVLLFVFAKENFERKSIRELVTVQKKIAGLSEPALERFVLRARKAVGLKLSVNVLVTSSTDVQRLNRRFLGKNKATDVLSFPSPFPAGLKGASLAGDIAISADIAMQNARVLGHSATQEIKILTLHGILHLAGFDHERDNGAMGRREMRLRRDLKLPVGLIERVTQRAGERSTGAATRRSR
jgi:probable rRNA maturation factor